MRLRFLALHIICLRVEYGKIFQNRNRFNFFRNNIGQVTFKTINNNNRSTITTSDLECGVVLTRLTTSHFYI